MVNQSKRKHQKQLWADPEFIEWLRRLKAKKELEGEHIDNLGELTRQLVGMEALKEIEKQMLQGSPRGIAEVKIRLDTRRMFR